MDVFRTLGSRSLSITAMLYFSGKANTSINDLGGDDTATHHIAASVTQIRIHLHGGISGGIHSQQNDICSSAGMGF